MRQVSLREFRTRGSKALKPTAVGETILLAGRNGPEYFLVPVLEDVATQDRELQPRHRIGQSPPGLADRQRNRRGQNHGTKKSTLKSMQSVRLVCAAKKK
jgi:antitoxin (DNA-binding transcriptional repressor) of toxin-antitoxin stability system